MKKIIFAIFVFSIMHNVHAQSPWAEEKGKGYFKSYLFSISGAHVINDAQKRIESAKFNYSNIGFYGAYGIMNKLTASLNIPVYSKVSIEDFTADNVFYKGGTLSGLGDADVGLIYQVNPEDFPWAISISANFGIPLGKKDSTSADYVLAIGAEDFNQRLGLNIGRGWGLSNNKTVYSAIHAGFNNRKAYSDEVRFGIDGGLGINNKLWIIARIEGSKSIENVESKYVHPYPLTTYANNSEYIGYTLELSYIIKNGWGVSASWGGAAIARNIYGEAAITAGIFWDMP